MHTDVFVRSDITDRIIALLQTVRSDSPFDQGRAAALLDVARSFGITPEGLSLLYDLELEPANILYLTTGENTL